MKAFVIQKYGSKDNVVLADVATPEIGTNDILVKIKAASVNPVDYRTRNGEFRQLIHYKMPLILGFDFAGIVEEVGSSVTKFKPGDEVYGLREQERNGSFAEFIAIHENSLALKPKNLSMEEAASVPLVGLTAWQALVEIAQLKQDQKVFIQAGSGGVGSLAIQLAKYMGATVATTAGQTSIKFVKDLGADVAIDYRKDDFEKSLRNYDVVLNSQDPKTLEKSLRILRRGGKLVSISGPPTPQYASEAGLSFIFKVIMGFLSFKTRRQAKKLGVMYSFLLAQPSGDQLRKLAEIIESEDIKAVIDTIYPFEKTNDALEHVESGRSKGKVVVKV